MPIRQDTLRLRWLAEGHYAPTTQATYTEALRSFERRFPVHAERVTAAMLIDFLTSDADGSETRRAPSTLSRQRATLRSFWRWAHRRGFVKADPSIELADMRLGRGERRAGRWLTKADARALLDACRDGTDQGARDETLIVVALLTGLRRSELASLQWRAVDLSNGRLLVHGKGGKLATLGLNTQAVAAIASWQARCHGLRGRAPRPTDPLLCSGRSVCGLNFVDRVYDFHWQQPLSKWGVRQIIVRRAEAAGLGLVSTHDLRRSFAGLLDEAGVDLKGIQAALRHSSPAVTATRYLDRSPRRATDAVARISI